MWRKNGPRRLLAAILALAALVLFSIANRGAYKSYFQADSIDNLALAQSLGARDLLQPLLVPKVFFNNFRPVGMLFFKLMGQRFGLWFPPYVAALHLVHMLNAVLLVWLLRRLKLPLTAACAGALFFVVHMALFSVHWEPMYVFDLLCGSFCLLSLIAYVDGRWIVSFILFWLACRAKEIAVMLPVILATYEFLLASRRWKRLVPFCALSVALGAQALINNAARQSDYTLRFDPGSLWQCLTFYSGQIFLVPFAGFAILLLPWLIRDRRLWFGVAFFLVLTLPLLLLPGRLAGAYLYVPLIGLSVAVAVLAERHPKAVIAALLLVWVPWNFVNLRHFRNTEMARGAAAHVYVASVIGAAQKYPDIHAYLYHESPMPWYVIPAVVNLVRHSREDVRTFAVYDRAAEGLLASEPLILLDWESTPAPGSVVTLARTKETRDLGYIRMDRYTPLWQLERGWDLDGRGPYRWMRPSAAARLERPAGATQFELTANITQGFLNYVHRSHLRVLIDGRLIGEREFDRPGLEALRWRIDPAPSGTARVSFEVQPGFQVDPEGDPMGLSVGDFGFVP